MNMTFEVKKYIYFIRGFATHEIYIISLRSMKLKSYSWQKFEYPLFMTFIPFW